MNDPYLLPPPPFELVQVWTPDAYDEVLLEWNPDGCYLMECGALHVDERLAQHEHGRVLALVAVSPDEDWVSDAIALGTPDAAPLEAV